jgi:glycosyltransferase involved in cell wall biosynthesis
MRILVYEPRTEGHHATWLQFLLDDILSSGAEVVAAVDATPAGWKKLNGDDNPIWKRLAVRTAPEAAGKITPAATLKGLVEMQGEVCADLVFMPCLDEIASRMLRNAAFGFGLPGCLRGKLAGIYHRPRFLAQNRFSPQRWLKFRGMRRLCGGGDLFRILFLDDQIARSLGPMLGGNRCAYLPDPCPAGLARAIPDARAKLNLPADRRIFLFYGGGYRRKGLHLVTRVFLKQAPANAFLLCAGRQPTDPEVRRQLGELECRNAAKVIDKYVTTEEEHLCFSACDVVLLPYVNHYGISAVLSQAAAAGKPVIASDEHQLGQFTRSHQLGRCFASGDVNALHDAIKEACQWGEEAFAKFGVNARRYAEAHSAASVRAHLLNALNLANPAH